MISTQDMKFVNVTPPAAIVDNTSFTTNSIDTKGWNYCTILFSLGATDIAMAALKVRESDTDGSYGDITGATFASALPSATDDNKIYAFFINLVGRKRFLDVVATAGDGSTGTYGSCIAILSRGDTAPSSDTTLGVGDAIYI